jgi:hypothetical protein
VICSFLDFWSFGNHEKRHQTSSTYAKIIVIHRVLVYVFLFVVYVKFLWAGLLGPGLLPGGWLTRLCVCKAEKNKNKKPDRNIHKTMSIYCMLVFVSGFVCVGDHEKNKTRKSEEIQLNTA